ncbi:MAG: NADPH-dependent F420 reductase [candidate division NC10 bacterium]|nr:NADPH-dependent F420 reductase [candidate division NC10 bacterium]
MNIGIIGTGNMGSGLGKLWAGKGHKVLFGSRDPQKANTLASSIGPNASGGTIADAAKFGEAVLLATPWAATRDAINAAGSLVGKILIDCTNPLAPDYMSLVVGHTTSGAEEIAKWATGAKVVKAFNAVFAQVLHSGNPLFGSEPATIFYCGDDAQAKGIVAGLITELDFEAIDAGPLKNARALEPLGELFVQLGYGLGMGTNIAVKVLRR